MKILPSNKRSIYSKCRVTSEITKKMKSLLGLEDLVLYVRHNSAFVSIPKTDDPYAIDIDRAIELIEGKRKADSETYQSI